MEKTYIIDGHCDTLISLLDDLSTLNNEKKHISLQKLQMGNVGIQFFAAWIGSRQRYGSPLQRGLRLIDRYYNMLAEHDEILQPILKYDDIAAIKRGQIGTLLTVEGGEILEGEIANLRVLYRLGVRLITLTWNHRNEIADGVMEKNGNGGLTDFGVEVVREMNKLGMIIDISHLSEKGFWDVMECSQDAVIASHSNAKTLCSHPRNLRDEQIIAIAQSKGLVGINFYAPFLAQEAGSVDDIIKHIEYIVQLAGVDSVGFGSDFDGIGQLPKDIEGAQHFPKIVERLLQINYTQEQVDKICFRNYLRVMEKVFK